MPDDRQTAVTRVDPMASMPAHLRVGKTEIVGLDHAKDYITPPFIKIVQKQSDDEMIAAYGIGTAILTPMGVEIARAEETFNFTPLMFWPEWAVWADIALKGQVPAILERTLEPTSEIALRAKDSNRREGTYTFDGKECKARWVEHLNFIVIVRNRGIDVPAVMSFARASHADGRKFLSLLQVRNTHPCGCVFAAKTTPRKNAKGQWHAFNVSNPDPDTVSPWVEADEFERLKSVADDLVAKHREGLVRVDLEGAVGEDGESDGADSDGSYEDV